MTLVEWSRICVQFLPLMKTWKKNSQAGFTLRFLYHCKRSIPYRECKVQSHHTRIMQSTFLHQFHCRTRRGKVLKIVREHYLRDDISCQSDLCEICAHSSVSLLFVALFFFFVQYLKLLVCEFFFSFHFCFGMQTSFNWFLVWWIRILQSFLQSHFVKDTCWSIQMLFYIKSICLRALLSLMWLCYKPLQMRCAFLIIFFFCL